MATITNNNDFILTPNQQQVLRNAAANMGVDEFIVGDKDYDEDYTSCAIYYNSTSEDGDTIEEFAFNLNLETDEIFA